MNNSVLSCTGLGKTYVQGSYQVKVLSNVDFGVQRAEHVRLR